MKGSTIVAIGSTLPYPIMHGSALSFYVMNLNLSSKPFYCPLIMYVVSNWLLYIIICLKLSIRGFPQSVVWYHCCFVIEVLITFTTSLQNSSTTDMLMLRMAYFDIKELNCLLLFTFLPHWLGAIIRLILLRRLRGCTMMSS